MKNSYNIVLFGVGYWGKNHLRELDNCQEVSKIFVIDPVAHNDNELLSSYKEVSFYKKFEDLKSKNEIIDGAIIATPPSTHFKLGKLCLENGLHTLIEKPMAESISELNILNELALKNKKVLMSGHTYLYHPAIKEMKKIIDSGKIGDIMFIHSQRLNFGIMRKDIDVFSSLAPHDISLVQFFLNDDLHIKINSNKSNFTFSPYDDFSSTLLEYDNNVFAQIDVSWYYPHKTRLLKVVGSKKTLVFDDTLKKIELFNLEIDKNYKHKNDGKIEIIFDKSIQPLKSEIDHFISYFKSPSDCITGYNHTKNVIKILEEYYKT